MLPFSIAEDCHLPTKLAFKGLEKMETVRTDGNFFDIWLIAPESIRNNESQIGSQTEILLMVRETDGIALSPWATLRGCLKSS